MLDRGSRSSVIIVYVKSGEGAGYLVRVHRGVVQLALLTTSPRSFLAGSGRRDVCDI